MSDILTRITETKREEVRALASRRDALERDAHRASPPRDFEAALAGGETVGVIAEVKRRSPGAGPIRTDLTPALLAGAYRDGGAAALSVLTDAEYFGGSLADLGAARDAVLLPVLRKDFTLDPIQVFEARAHGADAILLIVRILSDAALRSLRELAESLGMGVLVEAHDAEELDRAVSTGARIVGINNRDLSTFRTTLDVTLGLLDRLPNDAVVVSESGIRTPEDVRRLGEAGVHAVLVGESLLRQPDPGQGARALTGHPRVPRGPEP